MSPFDTSLQPARAWIALGADWGLITLCFASVMLLPHPLVFAAAVVLIARTQLALAVLMHESAHGLLLPRRACNDAVGQWLIAAPLMLSMPAYRRGHMQHHEAPMAADDPVVKVFGIGDYPVPRRELAWRLLKDLTGVGYVQTVWRLLRERLPAGATLPRPATGSSGPQVLASVLLISALMGGALAATGHAVLYLTLWLLPALTLLQVFARIRAITEHAAYSASDDQRLNARTIERRSWQTFFFGPHGVHFHIEHHEHVRVPFYRLQQVHRAMRAAGRLPEGNLYRSYWQVLRDVSYSGPARGRQSGV